jgi:hypothetical protein
MGHYKNVLIPSLENVNYLESLSEKITFLYTIYPIFLPGLDRAFCKVALKLQMLLIAQSVVWEIIALPMTIEKVAHTYTSKVRICIFYH